MLLRTMSPPHNHPVMPFKNTGSVGREDEGERFRAPEAV